MKFIKYKTQAEIEQLVFRVRPDFVDEFLKIDHEIWTRMLSTFDGFEGKEVWVSKTDPGRITQIIYWSTYEQWKSIPEDLLMHTQQRFDEAVGSDNYELIRAPHETDQQYRYSEYR